MSKTSAKPTGPQLPAPKISHEVAERGLGVSHTSAATSQTTVKP
jgi:hypothetical protein